MTLKLFFKKNISDNDKKTRYILQNIKNLIINLISKVGNWNNGKRNTGKVVKKHQMKIQLREAIGYDLEISFYLNIEIKI